MESILTSVKAMLGLAADYTPFDNEIVMHINTAFMVLHQLGVGTDQTFSITGVDESWSEFTPDIDRLGMVKSYVYLKTRLLFDPPTGGGAREALEKQVQEFEWRLNVEVETPSLMGV